VPAPSRVPFTKSKLALLLRRAYNQEKSNPQSDVNRPTKSFLFAFVFGDDSHAEEVPCPSRVFGYLSEGSHSCLFLPYDIVCLVQVLCLSRYFPQNTPRFSFSRYPLSNRDGSLRKLNNKG